uniref:Evasin n=1 Tax=Amblyomma triste TaxID=251400 RepID=A0A023G1P0_AMBTT
MILMSLFDRGKFLLFNIFLVLEFVVMVATTAGYIPCSSRFVHTAKDQIRIDCTTKCDGQRKVTFGGECAVVTTDEYNRMGQNIVHSCLLGSCYEGICRPGNLRIDCTKQA